MKPKTLTAVVALSLFLSATYSQAQNYFKRPKLVVGVVVDQMRWDYLIRYQDRYSEDGFKRLMNQGYNCNRTLINYLPSVTAVGHTAIYTGSVPAINGISSGSIYLNGRLLDTVYDEEKQPVGIEGKHSSSPHNLLVTTITDELRLATNFKSKVISVSLKDRASILPGGHTANAAYWFDGKSGNFYTSTYYMESLPSWVESFNAKKLADKYNKQGWQFLYDEDAYEQSHAKNPEIELKVGYDVSNSHFGNNIVLDFAREALVNEELGKDTTTDFLAVSLSAPDHIAHKVGPNSSYMEDLYLRLDKELAGFIDYLDTKVGKENYVLFLTADHAAANNHHFLKEHKIPAGYMFDNLLRNDLDSLARKEFGVDHTFVWAISTNQVFLHEENIKKYGVDRQKVIDLLCNRLMQNENIAYAFDFRNIPTYLPEPIRTMVVNGYHPKRNGQIQIIPNPQVSNPYSYGKPEAGTQHCVWNPYDCHIPLIFYGAGIPKGWDEHTYHITDIAPTLAAILNIQQPSGCVGNVITPVLSTRNDVKNSKK